MIDRHANPSTLTAHAPKSGGSLRSKLLLSITLTTAVAVIALSAFAINRALQTQTFLGGALSTSVKKEGEGLLRNTVTSEAKDADEFLHHIADEVSAASKYASNLFGQQAILSQGDYWDARAKLAALDTGALDNPNADPAAIFIPTFLPLNDTLIAELNTMIYLDHLSPATLAANTSIVAMYYISEGGATIYYPNIDLATLVPPDFDPTAAVFFSAANPQNDPQRRSVWTPPYQDPAGTGLIVTNVSPVYDPDDRFRGVVAADVQLTRLVDRIIRIRVGRTGYGFLIDSDGHIIAMPNSGYSDLGITPENVPFNETPTQTVFTAGPQSLQSTFRLMTLGASSLTRLTLNGEERYIAYARMPATNYSLAVIVPVAELDAPLTAANAQVAANALSNIRGGLLVISAVFLFTAATGILLSRTLTAPLAQLTRTAEQLAAGDLEAEAPVTTADEIGLLARTFNAMAQQLRGLVGSLELRVAERTRDLALATEVGRAVSQVRDLDALLADAVELIRSRFDFYYTQVYLTDSAQRTLVLHAGTGAVGQQLRLRGFKLPIGPGSINGTAAAEKRAIFVANAAASATFRPNPLLPLTQSEMAVPLLVGERVVGVLDMQSDKPGIFSADNLPAFEALAGQLAIAIENASLFSQTEQARAEMETHARRLTTAGWQNFLNAVERSERIVFTYESPEAEPGQPTESASPAPTDTLDVPIQVAGESVGAIRVESPPDRKWTEEDAVLAHTVALRVAQQVENIRLLTQAEKYRAEAEEAVRRLTREGWAGFADSTSTTGSYVYDGEQVVAADSAPSADTTARPITVRGETIGELLMSNADLADEDAAELLEAVVSQLSTHIENLRLTEQTQAALSETQLLYESSAQLNAATTLEETLLVAARPGISAGADNALLFIFDLDSAGKPEWMEVRANWVSEGSFTLPVGIRFFVPSHPLSRLWINSPDVPIFISDAATDQRVDGGISASLAQTNTRALVILPLVQGGKWIGLIIINWLAPHNFTPSDQLMYTSIATQTAVVVNNQLLFASTQAALTESEKLYEASRRLASASTLQEIMAAVVEGVPVPAVNRAVLMAYQLDSSGGLLGAEVTANWHNGEGAPPTPIGHRYPPGSFTPRSILLSPQPIFLDDAQNDPRVDAAARLMLAQQKVRGLAILPLWAGGKQLGVMLAQCENPHHFADGETRPYISLAQQMAIAVDNRRLFEQTQAALSETAALYQASARLNAATTPHETLLAIAQSALASGANSAFLLAIRHDPSNKPDSMEVIAALDGEGQPFDSMMGMRFRLADSPYSELWMADPSRPFTINDVAADPRLSDTGRAVMAGTGATVTIPLNLGGRWIGVVSLSWPTPRIFTEPEIRLYQSLGAQAATVLDNQLLLKQTQKLAERESIINLINQKIQSATSVEAAIQTAVRELGQTFKARRTVVELSVGKEPKSNN